MLSQKTSLIGLSLKTQSSEELEGELKSLLDEMRLSHIELSCTNFDFKCDFKLEQQIDSHLRKHLDIFEFGDVAVINKYIRDDLPSFLKLLDQRVASFQRAAEKKADSLVLAERFILTLILISLILEFKFIFSPVLSNLTRSLKAVNASEREKSQLLLQKEQLLESISHYLRSPLNQFRQSLQSEEADMDTFRKVFVDLQQAVTFLLEFQTKKKLVKEIAKLDPLKEDLSSEQKLRVGLDEVHWYSYSRESLESLVFTCFKVAWENHFYVDLHLSEKSKIRFAGAKQSLAKLISSFEKKSGLSTIFMEKLVTLLQGLDAEMIDGKTYVEFKFELEKWNAVKAMEPSNISTKSKVKKVETVLIVDDTELNLKVMRSRLEKMGLEVFEAKDGKEAIAKANSLKFDLIFMDKNMPLKNGVEATRELRNLGVDIPIYFVTANSSLKDVESYIDAGAQGVIVKPVNNAELLETVEFVNQFSSATKITILEDVA